MHPSSRALLAIADLYCRPMPEQHTYVLRDVGEPDRRLEDRREQERQRIQSRSVLARKPYDHDVAARIRAERETSRREQATKQKKARGS